MQRLTLEDGTVIERVYVGFVDFPEDVRKLTKEVKAELKAKDSQLPLMVCVWKCVALPEQKEVKMAKSA